MRQGLRERLGNLDPVIVLFTVGLVLLGLIFLLSATGPVAFQRASGDSLYYVKRQLLNGVLPGIFLFLFFSLVDYRVWKKFAPVALVATFVLLVLVYIPGLGVEVGGARGWIRVAGISLQTSELAKLSFLIYLSAWLAERSKGEIRQWNEGVFPFLLTLGAVVLLLVLQPDTGSTAVIAGMSLALFFLAGAPLPAVGGFLAAGAAGLFLLLRISPYRAERFLTFLHPELDPQGIGYHINQAMLAIGSGGFLGVGYGHSRQKFLYLPEVEADSIFAVVAEELGFFLSAVLLLGFAFLIWRCFSIARNSRDRFGALLAAGVAAWIGAQLLLNVGSMTGLLPITGVTMPFISHGGSSLAVLLAAMGLVAGIPRHAQERSV